MPVNGQPVAYPLQWPLGRPRTKTRRKGGFSTTLRNARDATASKKPKPLTLYEARRRLASQLDLLRARSSILSSNVELGVDGYPRSSSGNPHDPGAAVYFYLKDKSIVLACDSFTEVAQNVAAIAAHIDAMRRMERYGVATTEEMFTGFLAIPPSMVMDDWRAALDYPSTVSEAEAVFRRKMKTAHPDLGGTTAMAAALNAAIDMARKQL